MRQCGRCCFNFIMCLSQSFLQISFCTKEMQYLLNSCFPYTHLYNIVIFTIFKSRRTLESTTQRIPLF